MFCYENDLTYPVYVSNKKFENCIDLLLKTDENRSHYVYIEDFNRFMCNKTKDNYKKYFCGYYLQCFPSERDLIEHKENCLIINGKQSVKLRSDSIKLKNQFKQLAVPFKIYADFKCNVKGVKSSDKNNASYTKQYQSHYSLYAYKVVCINDKFSKPVVLRRGKNAVNKFIEAIQKENDYYEKVIKNHFDEKTYYVCRR